MSAALLKINKSVCHLCAALDRHATVHLGPFAERIGSWILKSRLASGKLGDKQTNQTAKQNKKKRGGVGGLKLSSCGLSHHSSSQMRIYFFGKRHLLTDGQPAWTLSPENFVISARPEINAGSADGVRKRRRRRRRVEDY